MLNPHLPKAPPDLDPYHTRQHRAKGGFTFHRACLEFSQSLWLQEKPAQAILQLNKASMTPDQAAPYPALVWFLAHRRDHLFIGNPVRHFQHLASRISGDHARLRSWRAWACFHLAEISLPWSDFPRDQQQIDREQLQIPIFSDIEKKLPSCDSSTLSVAKALARTFASKRP
ncbi:MAG: hypothetical protein ACPIG7_10565 [Akkermansiaceae bacterium]|nr:hypothetical protein [Akkermansiaceae bacterium]